MTVQPVYIVGAGPGDPELLTVKALRVIENYAEVVVYDRLIPKEIMDIVPDRVERVYAGKSCKQHVMTQDAINACLLDYAKRGRRVVRLKGGDPFIFGRGGEEVLYLLDHQIPCEVVPGITAAGGIAAHHCIPLTHRQVASGVHYLTGHQQSGEDPLQDWQQLARADSTLVFYMGLTHLAYIAQQLMDHGLAGTTPAMIVEWGTTPQEKSATYQLNELTDKTKALPFEPPCLIVVGKVLSVTREIQSKQLGRG